MAKAATKTESTETNETNDEAQVPATSTGFALSADFLSEVADVGDLGYSEKQEDSMIPILAILQENSGEAKQRHSKRVEGANAGDLIIRSLQRVISIATEGPLTFQPCGFQHVWVEWQGEVGEGVPVGQFMFDSPPEDTREVQDPENADKKMLIRDNGNRLVDTRYHFGYALTEDGAMPLVIPMAGTNHTVSRQWTATMKQFNIPGSSNKAPAFMRKYTVGTKYRERGSQSWFMYEIKDMGWIQDEAQLRAGLEMMKSLKNDEITANVGEMGEGGGANVQDPDNIPI